MKLKGRTNSHFIDFFFTLSLFCVFSVCAFFVVIIGANVYQSTVLQLEDTYSTRTALAYVTEKVRQHDIAGAVSITEIEGETALLLKDSVNGEIYETYIYPNKNALFELTVREGTAVSKALGQKILEVNDFSMTEPENGFLELRATDSSGAPMSVLLHLRNEQY